MMDKMVKRAASDDLFSRVGFDMFDTFFSQSLKEETFSAEGGRINIDIELAGVDPKTIRVARRLDKVRVTWTSRLGKNESRQYTLQDVRTDPVATYDHGLLRITFDVSAQKAEWTDVPIKMS